MMNWDRIGQNWPELEHAARDRWTRLTEEDLERVHGERERLVDVLTERYGYSPQKAEQEIDAWASTDPVASPGDATESSRPAAGATGGTIEPDVAETPGVTPLTMERGWGEALLAIAGILVLIGTIAGVFFFFPLLLVALVGLILVPIGTRMIRRGKSRRVERDGEP